MQKTAITFSLISFLLAPVLAGDLPSWIVKGSTIDSTYYYVTCSHEGIDPEETKQIAESKCLASAAKLGGVQVKLNGKTVQSLTGVDASEVAEIQPLSTQVICEWTQKYLEKVGQGFRVWLQCRVKKSDVIHIKTTDANEESKPILASGSPSHYKRGTLIITTVPQADRIVVIGDSGERVIEVTSNVTKIELREGDNKIRVKKQQYKDSVFIPSPWGHGAIVSKTIYLEKGL